MSTVTPPGRSEYRVAIIVPADGERSLLDRLRRAKVSERQVVSVSDEHGEVTMSPAEPLRF